MISRPSFVARAFGLGSVFGKTFRDSRRTAVIIGIVFVLIIGVTAQQISAEFATAAKRLAFAAQMTSLPAIFQGMLGEAISLDRLGGFLSWRTINFLPVMLGIWTVVVLAGSLSGELARGSLDVVAVSPLSRARIALEKLLGFLMALGLVTLIFVVGAFAAINGFASLPGDEVGLDAVLGHGIWIFVAALVPGAAAFAVAPFLGRGGALGVGSITLFASYVVSSYASTISALKPVETLSYFAITAHHRPIAGVWDWPAVGAVAVVVVVLLGVGVAAFVRRDLLVPSGGRLQLPALRIFVHGAFTRSLGERMPAAVLWGVALAVYGAIIAFSADEFVATLASIPEIVQMIHQVLPNADIESTAGFLQLAFFTEAIVFIGLATAALVAGWASDENERRLEVVLSAPLSRLNWGIRSASAVMTGIAIFTVLLAVGVVLGSSTQAATGDMVRPTIGVFILGLYGMALAGVGLAVGGLVRPGLAAPVTLLLALAFFLLDLIGSILNLPDPVLDLALSRHLGQPMIGVYDWPGMIACAVLAIGGVIVCAIGMRRRDIGR
jgi:putative exporter of polyketide antibiotics